MLLITREEEMRKVEKWRKRVESFTLWWQAIKEEWQWKNEQKKSGGAMYMMSITNSPKPELQNVQMKRAKKNTHQTQQQQLGVDGLNIRADLHTINKLVSLVAATQSTSSKRDPCYTSLHWHCKSAHISKGIGSNSNSSIITVSFYVRRQPQLYVSC